MNVDKCKPGNNKTVFPLCCLSLTFVYIMSVMQLYHQRMLRIIIVFFITVLLPVSLPAQSSVPIVRVDSSAKCKDTIIMTPGTCSGRYFGDLLIRYSIDNTGDQVTCSLYLASQLVGLRTLNVQDTLYNFTVVLGNTKASGQIALALQFPPRLSTLKGNFTYSVAANNMSFTFTGDLAGWYITNMRSLSPPQLQE
jgi:hypothetical protein